MQNRTAMHAGLRALHAAALVLVVLCATACVNHGRPQPHTRFGALPFPGVTSLFHAADPADLGPHHYAGWSQRPFQNEGERGIIYTDRAGFVDVVHIRLAADWSWYVHASLRDARTATRPEPRPSAIAFPYEGARVTIRLPQDPAEDAALAAHAGCALMTWHEIATWYGCSMVPLVSERRSSFTYDDTISHLLGADAAYRVILDGATWETYDAAMEQQIGQALAALGARAPHGTRDACTDAMGLWWAGNAPGLRDTDTHMDATPKRPLLLTTTGGATLGEAVVALPGAPAVPQPWITIEPQPQALERVTAVLGRRVVEGDADLQSLIDDVAADFERSEHAIVLRHGDADVPARAARRVAASTAPLTAQYIAPSRPAAPRAGVESVDTNAAPR